MRAREAGFSLAEMLVSITILALATLVALVIYDGARRTFKVGENRSEQQQGVRIAFDRIDRDLRVSGFNVNPDGDPNRPDEAIEGAWDTALVIRADFDADDPANRFDPEVALASGGSPFQVVSTGNDEIVAFVLASPDGSSSDTLDFVADIADPRDGVPTPVSIPGVALTQGAPPYTLYRVTLRADATPERVPQMESVRLLRFTYYDESGQPIAAPGGAETQAARLARAAIRRIGIEIDGLTRDPDPQWQDPADPDPATRGHRKFRLAADVTPRNLGRQGMKDLEPDSQAPGAPAPPQGFAGHCEGLIVRWVANPPADGVEYYRVRYGQVPGPLNEMRAAQGTVTYLANLVEGADYDMRLEAVDTSGNVSPASLTTRVQVQNTNVPSGPQNVVASQDLNGSIVVSWDAVLTNSTSTPPEDPIAPTLRDGEGYNVYRGTSSGFSTSSSNLRARIDSLSVVTLADEPVVHCRQYYYKVRAFDRCDSEGPRSAAAPGTTVSTVAPRPPSSAEAFDRGSQQRIEWDPVHEDVDGRWIEIDTYRICNSGWVSGAAPSVPAGYPNCVTVTGTTQYDLTPFGFRLPGQRAYSIVAARDDCGNQSAFSAPFAASCAFSGSASLSAPGHRSTVAGSTSVTAEVISGSGSYVQAELAFVEDATGTATNVVLAGPGPQWSTNWDTSALAPGRYRIHAGIQQSNGCVNWTSILVFVEAP